MSKILSNQKHSERWIFDLFKEHYPEKYLEIPQSELDPDPDFLLQGTDSKVIGIELTEYHHNPLLRSQYGYRNTVIQLAQTEFEKINKSIIVVYFHFDFRFHENIAREGVGAKEVAHRIGMYVNGEIYSNEPAIYDPNQEWEKLEQYGLADYFFSIKIHYFPTVTKNFWSQSSAFFGWKVSSPETIEALNQVILKKNTKCDSYLRKCDECWLVIHFDGNEYSSLDMENVESDISNINPELFARSKFSKVILFDW